MTDDEEKKEQMIEDLVALARNFRKTPQAWMKREALNLVHLIFKR